MGGQGPLDDVRTFDLDSDALRDVQLLDLGTVSDADVEALCDGGEGVAFGVRLDNFHLDGNLTNFLDENGRIALYVDRNCRYYSDFGYADIDDPLSPYWRERHLVTGTFTIPEARELLTTLRQPGWEAWAGKRYAGPSSEVEIWTVGNLESPFLFDRAYAEEVDTTEAAAFRGLQRDYFEIAALLEGEGEVWNGDSVRIFVDHLSEALLDQYIESGATFRAWPDTIGADPDVLANRAVDYCAGDSHLVTDPSAVAALKEHREQFRSLGSTVDWIGYTFDDKHYALWMREVIPLENAHGLIEFGVFGTPGCR